MIRRMFTPFITGIGTGAGLIIAIGAQNAFILTQGIRKDFHLTAALICSLIDALLITTGVLGMGRLVQEIPLLLPVASLGGALFLLIYGIRSLISALKPSSGIEERSEKVTSRRKVILTTLVISLLNPHVYLDTVVLLGGISTSFPPQDRIFFALGAILMSFIWFFSLALGGGALLPLFRKQVTWRILDGLIFVIMWSIAYRLILFSGIF